MVFNVFSENFSPIVFSCSTASNGCSCRIPTLYDMANTSRRVVRRYSNQTRMCCKERFALSQRGRMRLYCLNCFKRRVLGTDQIMRNWHDDFRNDSQVTLEQQIVRTVDRSNETVFQRSQNIISALFFDRPEKVVKSRSRNCLTAFSQNR